MNRTQSPDPFDADLLELFHLPVYAQLRRNGHAAPAAAALTAAFLLGMRGLPHGAAHDGPRDILRAKLQQFLAAAPVLPAALDPSLEARYLEHFPPQLDAEACFDRALGLGVMAAALAALRLEADRGGRLELFDALAPWLAREPRAGEYGPLAQRLKLAPLLLHTALRRLRQRFRELVDSAMIRALGDGDDLPRRRAALQDVFVPE